MYQVMVVEDDYFFSTSFINMISWERLNCNILAVAKNGEEAVRFLLDNRIDIVITDVEMPYMNGVQLIEYIRNNHPSVKCIMLSNFDSFEYVKDSMKQGAVDYLLKHQLTQEGVEALIRDVLTSLEMTHVMKNESAEEDLTLQYIRPIVKENYLRSFLEGQEGPGRKYFHKLFPDFPSSNIFVVIFKIDNDYQTMSSIDDGKKQQFLNAFVSMCQQTIQTLEKGIITHIDTDTFCLLFSSDTPSSLYLTSQLNAVIGKLKTTIKRFFNLTCSFGISDICPSIAQLPAYYESAKKKVNHTYFEGRDAVVRTVPPDQTGEFFTSLDLKEEKELYRRISLGDDKEVERLLRELFEHMRRNSHDRQNFQALAMELVNLSMRVCKNKHIDVRHVYSSTNSPHRQILQYSNYEALLEYLIEKFNKITSLLDGNSQHNHLTRQAIAILQSQYDKELSLGMVADILGTNSSYLSRVFKNDLSVGFAEYLTALRIEKVRNLMETENIDIKSAALQCGFTNYNYFFKIFKEHCGVTPQEYKNSRLM